MVLQWAFMCLNLWCVFYSSYFYFFGLNAGLNITSGKLLIDVEYIGIHIQQTKDLCKETSCPVSTGDFVLTHKETLPFLTPPVSLTLCLNFITSPLYIAFLLCWMMSMFIPNIIFWLSFCWVDWLLNYCFCHKLTMC